MQYLFNLLVSTFELEITIAILVGIILILMILLLTVIKKLKDK